MTTATRATALALSLVLTFSMLICVDQLAQVEAGPAAMAQASAPRA